MKISKALALSLTVAAPVTAATVDQRIHICTVEGSNGADRFRIGPGVFMLWNGKAWTDNMCGKAAECAINLVDGPPPQDTRFTASGHPTFDFISDYSTGRFNVNVYHDPGTPTGKLTGPCRPE